MESLPPADWLFFSCCSEDAARFNVGRLPYLERVLDDHPYPDAIREEMRLIKRRADELGISVQGKR